MVLAVLADRAQGTFRALLALQPAVAWPVTPCGMALAVWAARRYFPNAQGSGIPQAIAARQLADPVARGRLVSLRIAAGKTLLTLLGLLCGASTGREGPTVQIGASLMFAIGRLSPRRQPGLILAGAAAGVAAAFNTPLAGIVFGIEEMSRSYEARASGLIIGAIIAAGLTSLALLGSYTYFGTTPEVLGRVTDWLAVPACGVAGGLMGALFSRILILFARGLPGRVGRLAKAWPVPVAMLCGLGIVALDHLSPVSVYGTGYLEAQALLDGSAGPSLFFFPCKLLATALSAVSGLPGGIFSPSLAIGAGIGADISLLLPGTPVGAVVLLGMVAYLTGVMQAPITAFVIVAELTDNHGMLLPLMATAVIAEATARQICREGIYHELARGFRGPVAAVPARAAPASAAKG